MSLIQLKEKTEQKQRIAKQLKLAQLELIDSNKKLANLKIELKKEFDDVQRLEGSSISALFYSFLGNKVEKLDKERQEYVAAKLKYDQCLHEIEDLNNEISQLEINLVNCGNPETEYKQKLDEKTSQLKQNGDEQILEFEQKLQYLYHQKKEIKEAVAAGNRVLQGLGYAIQYLKKAANWGTFDIIGGGILATAMKHSNIDEAKDLINHVQVWLRKFKRELSDVKINELPDLSIEINSFSKFADYFFDNLIFDWAVQSKINRSLENCLQVQIRVSKIIGYLNQSDKNLTQNYQTVKTSFNRYIENHE